MSDIVAGLSINSIEANSIADSDLFDENVIRIINTLTILVILHSWKFIIYSLIRIPNLDYQYQLKTLK